MHLKNKNKKEDYILHIYIFSWKCYLTNKKVQFESDEYKILKQCPCGNK